MRSQSAKEKRRARDAARRAAEIETQHQHALVLSRETGKQEGYRAGVQHGAKSTRDAVLDHAGRLYKEGKDTDAAAVREVYRRIPS